MIRFNTTLDGWDKYDGSGWDTHKTATLTGADSQTSEPMDFVYDPVRAKYLSSQHMAKYWVAQTVATDDYINWAAIFPADVGDIMPYNGTITAMTAYVSDINLCARHVSVYVGATENTQVMTLGIGTSDNAYTLTKTNINLNFAAGNNIRIRMRYSAGTSSRQWASFNLIMYYKWRI